MKLIRLNKSDGTWDELNSQWSDQCNDYQEDFESYASASLSTLANECDEGDADLDTGVFALQDEGGVFHSACFLNCTFLKGYTGKVLRVRHLVLSPYYDFEDLELEDYAITLAHAFSAIFEISNGTLNSQHLKIHYRSPYDRTFFAAFALTMKNSSEFKSVESKGMWLHITKA